MNADKPSSLDGADSRRCLQGPGSQPGNFAARIFGSGERWVSTRCLKAKLNSAMENKDLARCLYETADLMEIAGEDGFRIRSYRNGASAIESHPERVADILKNPNRKVTDIPGIGKGLAAVLADIIERGSCERRDYWLEKYPPAALEFLKIQGLGPKGIAVLFEHHKITTMDELEKLCVEQKLRTLPRMGAKLEEKVLRSIEQYRRSSGRFLLSFAEQVSQDIIGYLSEL